MNGLEKIRLAIQDGSQQADLIVGYLCLCKTIKSKPEQAAALASCADALLEDYPILGLKVIKLALQIDPDESSAVAALRATLKRRGRWATEARLAELSRTQLSVSAASPPASVMENDYFRSDTVESEPFVPVAPEPFVPVAPEPFTPVAPEPFVPVAPEPFVPVAPEPFVPVAPEPFTPVAPESFVPVAPEPFTPVAPEPFTPVAPEPFTPVAPESFLPADPPSSLDLSKEDSRMREFLARCGFDLSFMQYAKGMSSNNCGLVTFVGILQRLQLIEPQDMPLAESMLFKMLQENPDGTEALNLFHEMFRSKSKADKGER